MCSSSSNARWRHPSFKWKLLSSAETPGHQRACPHKTCAWYTILCGYVTQAMHLVLLHLLTSTNRTFIGGPSATFLGYVIKILVCSLGRLPAVICHLGFVHPLQDVALHQCLPSSSVAFLIQVVPSFSVMSSCHLLLGRPLPSPWLPLCASLCPPIVL